MKSLYDITRLMAGDDDDISIEELADALEATR